MSWRRNTHSATINIYVPTLTRLLAGSLGHQQQLSAVSCSGPSLLFHSRCCPIFYSSVATSRRQVFLDRPPFLLSWGFTSLTFWILAFTYFSVPPIFLFYWKVSVSSSGSHPSLTVLLLFVLAFMIFVSLLFTPSPVCVETVFRSSVFSLSSYDFVIEEPGRLPILNFFQSRSEAKSHCA